MEGKKPLWWTYTVNPCSCDPNKPCPHKIDLSAGFEFRMTYNDGFGTAEGHEWS